MRFRLIRFRALSTYGIAPVKTPLRYNDFGWTPWAAPFGFRVFSTKDRDKLFFFAAQEFKRLRNTQHPRPRRSLLQRNFSTALPAGPTTATGRQLAAYVAD